MLKYLITNLNNSVCLTVAHKPLEMYHLALVKWCFCIQHTMWYKPHTHTHTHTSSLNEEKVYIITLLKRNEYKFEK